MKKNNLLHTCVGQSITVVLTCWFWPWSPELLRSVWMQICMETCGKSVIIYCGNRWKQRTIAISYHTQPSRCVKVSAGESWRKDGGAAAGLPTKGLRPFCFLLPFHEWLTLAGSSSRCNPSWAERWPGSSAQAAAVCPPSTPTGPTMGRSTEDRSHNYTCSLKWETINVAWANVCECGNMLTMKALQ